MGYVTILVNLHSMVFVMMVPKLIITNITVTILMMIWEVTTQLQAMAAKHTMLMLMMTIIWLITVIVCQLVLRAQIVLIVVVSMPLLTTLSLLPQIVVLKLVLTHVHMLEMVFVMILEERTIVS